MKSDVLFLFLMVVICGVYFIGYWNGWRDKSRENDVMQKIVDDIVREANEHSASD